MSDSWSIPKPLGYLAAVAAAIVTIGGAWKMLDLPIPASRSWVTETIEPYRDDSLRLLIVRRRLALAELFQWESNTVMNDNIRLNIEELKSEIGGSEPADRRQDFTVMRSMKRAMNGANQSQAANDRRRREWLYPSHSWKA